jgi:pimeloyl-ACP methyl ester carboxylesterase
MAGCHGSPGIRCHLSSQAWMPSPASRRANSSTAGLSVLLFDLMMKTKPDSQALKDYQASSAGRRFIEAMAYVRAYPIDLPSLRAMLPGIRTPVLSIWGAHDPIVPPENADVLGRALPRMRSVLLDSGHFVWEDRAEDYAAAILDWIRGGYKAA